MADDSMALGYALGQDSGNSRGGGMFGDGEGWWAIILFAMIFGWGNGGWGGGGNAGGQGGADTRAAIYDGFALNGLDNGIRGVQQGLCDGFYAVNTGMLQGFNGVNTTMLQGFNGVERGFCNLSSQLANCCCENREAIAQVRYDMATQACDTRNTIQNTTRDIIDNQNANTRSIMDFLVQDKLATLQAENQTLKFAASQSAQNAYLTATMDANTAELLRRLTPPSPVPSYSVPAPYPYCGQGYNNCGCGC